MTESQECVKLNEHELRKMQLLQLDMLIEFDRICNKHNIGYILDAGTLLGAVRNKGFIPWDDDIDVRMLRSEYEHFCRVVRKELDKGKYFFQNEETDPDYFWGYAKIRRNGTEFIRLGQEHLKMKTGVFIDIFPCDGVPGNKMVRKIHNFFALLSRKITYSRIGVRTEKNPIVRIGYRILMIFPVTLSFHIIHWLSRNCDERRNNLVGCIAWYGDKDKTGFKKEWFTERQYIEFEGKQFQAPKDYHGFLVHSFGKDYMTPPPMEKRIGSALATSVKLID
ncbi:MAG TPA: LicD family protein [Mobilitalea sp.]|nr:LicD family protein [Mobilitalea sp.]